MISMLLDPPVEADAADSAGFGVRFWVAIVTAALVLAGLLRVLTDEVLRLYFAITVVVALGAAGLVLRGLGEMAGDPAVGRRRKSRGYFLGAAAYVFTAAVALVNGVERLVAR